MNAYLSFFSIESIHLAKLLYTIFIGITAMITCWCYYMLKESKIENKNRIWIIYSILFVFALFFFISPIIERIQTPVIWDYTAFYLYGKIASEGQNFYLPENFHNAFNAAHLPFTHYQDFVEEVLNVGFPYPSPTILYFMPLGYIPYNSGLMYWTIFILIFAIGSIYLIYSMFFKADKLNGLMLVIILFCISTHVRSTILCTQTNFILLFLLLLMRKYYDHKIAGIFLALAFFTKPYMLIFGLFFLFTGRWKAIAYFITSSLLIVASTILIIGKETFFSYFSSNATLRLPNWAFSQPVNQSLHGVLLRANLITIEKPFAYLIISALLLTLLVGYLVFLIKQKKYDYIWVVLLLAGLISYPGTLSHYAVLLFFIIFQFFNTNKPLGINMNLNIPVIGLFYLLSTVSVFSALFFLLSVIIISTFSQYLPIKQATIKSIS